MFCAFSWLGPTSGFTNDMFLCNGAYTVAQRQWSSTSDQSHLSECYQLNSHTASSKQFNWVARHGWKRQVWYMGGRFPRCFFLVLPKRSIAKPDQHRKHTTRVARHLYVIVTEKQQLHKISYWTHNHHQYFKSGLNNEVIDRSTKVLITNT